LNWSFRKSTSAARKLPNDWEQKGLQMAQRAAYLVKGLFRFTIIDGQYGSNWNSSYTYRGC
jgi:hypothetical protein